MRTTKQTLLTNPIEASVRLLSIIAIMSFGAVPALAAIIDPALDQRLAVGSGLDSSTLEARDDCVERSKEVSQGGPQVTYSLKVIENSSDLRKILGVSAMASLKAALGEGGGKADFSDSVNINQYSLYAIAVTRVINSQTLLRDVTLKKDALELYSSDIEQFRKRCGDQFITGFLDGGEFIGVISIQTTNAEQKRNIRTAVSASYGIFSASGSVNKSTLDSTNSYDQAVLVHRAGGESNIAEPETLEKLVEISANFPARLSSPETAVKISLLTRSYSTLNVPPQELQIFRSRERRQVIEQLSALLDQVRDLEANVNYVLGHPEQFVDVNKDALWSAIESARSVKNEIRASARSCFSGEKCELPSLQGLSTLDLPQRRGDQVKGVARACSASNVTSEFQTSYKNLLDPKFMELASSIDVCEVLRSDTGVIHSRGPTNDSPLHVAAYSSRQASVIDLLIEHGADTDAWDINGRLPLHYALQYNENPDIIRMLIAETGGELPDTEDAPRAGFLRRPALHLAAENGNPAITRLLLSEYKQDVHTTDSDGATALHVAAAVGNIRTVKVLIESGSSVDAQDGMGRTPLHTATINGRSEAIDVLLRNGADPTLIDNAGNTMLHFAAMLMSGRNAYELKRADSDVDVWTTAYFSSDIEQKNIKGHTALDVLVDGWGPLHEFLKRVPEVGTVAKDAVISEGDWKQAIHAVKGYKMKISNASNCQSALLMGLLKQWFGGMDRRDVEGLSGVDLLTLARQIGHPYMDDMIRRQGDAVGQEKFDLNQSIRAWMVDIMQRLDVAISLVDEIHKAAGQVGLVIEDSNSSAEIDLTLDGGQDQTEANDEVVCRYEWITKG